MSLIVQGNTIVQGVTNVNPNIVTSGLVLYLNAGVTDSYPGSGTTWYDLSGYRNDGTLTNGPTYSSANGGSIVFDGTNDYAITTPTPLTGTETALTIACWFKPANINTIKSIVAIGDEANGKRRIILQRNAQIEANGYNADVPSVSSVLVVGSWCYIGIVYTSLTTTTGVTLYFNGNAIPSSTTGSTTLNNFTNTKCTVCGNNATPAIENAQGNVASVQIYNRALSAAEMAKNYNAYKSRFGL